MSTDTAPVALPPPDLDRVALQAVLSARRSRRSFRAVPVGREELATLCWAAQGVTDDATGYRTAPSAGATFPLEVLVVVAEDGVPDLRAGIYSYDSHAHELVPVADGSFTAALCDACLDQDAIDEAPVTLVLTAIPERTSRRYAARGRERYVPMEVGHAGQNLYLAAEALGLGTVCAGAFDDAAVAHVLGLTGTEQPMAVYPVGVPR